MYRYATHSVKNLIPGLLAIIFPILLHSQDLTLKANETIGRYMDSLSIPGISCAIIQDGSLVYKESFGYANLEHKVPLTDSSVFRIWSVSKQFCAAAIFKLAQEDRLNIDDSILTYLDDIPDSWQGITIRELLSNTAGIKDYLNDFPEGRKLIGVPYSQVQDSVSGLMFPDGSDWRYSNTNFWVATKVVERISGSSYQEYLQTNFFDPLNMTNTFKSDDQKLVPNRVGKYRKKTETTTNDTRWHGTAFESNGDAELMSTLDDLVVWTQALTGGKVVPEKHLQYAWIPARLEDGRQVNGSYIIYYDSTATYGMGYFISWVDGKKLVWTPGAGPGVSTCILSMPDQNTHIVVLCNLRRFLIADKLARALALTITP